MSESRVINLGEIDGAGFKVVVEDYSGPIDLLLHLVKSSELQIEKLSLAHVANQYLACLDSMQKLDLEIAGEYLVIAATLLSIKSSVLLNEPVELIVDEDGNLVDPHEELLKKLREAAIYRDGAKQLEAMDRLGQQVFASPSQLNKFKPNDEVYADHDPMLLGRAFRKIIAQLESRGLKYVISLDPISIVDTMMSVMEKLKISGGKPLEFSDLVGSQPTKSSVIATFLALLELCKRSAISVRQGVAYDQILIMQASETETIGFESEFDSTEIDLPAIANA